MGQAVTVDNDFARFGAKSYAINKINSVEVRVRRPHGQGMAYVLFALGLILVFAALGTVSSPDGDPVSTLVFAGVCLAASYWQWQRAKVREYQLFLMTSSSEAQAFVTRDEGEVWALRDKIEAAMMRHSQGGIAA